MKNGLFRSLVEHVEQCVERIWRVKNCLLYSFAIAHIKYKKLLSPIVPAPASEDFDDEMIRLIALNSEDITKYPWTNIGAGILFADFYENCLRYVSERKSWFYYENGIWKQDVNGLKAMKLYMNLANLLHMYALKITDDHKRKSYMDYSKKWQSHGCRVNILKDAQVYHPISVSEFDFDPYIFNCKNGTLRVDTFECLEHKSSDKLTKISNVIYAPNAKSHRWNEFISVIMSSDKEEAKFLLNGNSVCEDERLINGRNIDLNCGCSSESLQVK